MVWHDMRRKKMSIQSRLFLLLMLCGIALLFSGCGRYGQDGLQADNPPPGATATPSIQPTSVVPTPVPTTEEWPVTTRPAVTVSPVATASAHLNMLDRK